MADSASRADRAGESRGSRRSHGSLGESGTGGDEKLLALARELLPAAVTMRRRIHAEPELGLQLPKTKAVVLESLAGLDLDISHSQNTSGLVATLEGSRPGKRLLLRGDMDALPMPEDTGLEFASRIPGRMHACGHDSHTAMLAAAAHLLSQRRDELAGSVSFMFQPGEEGHFGAKVMIEEGLLGDADHFDGAFAIHIAPPVPCGMLGSRGGPMLASADVFTAKLKGRGGHASMPYDALDPIPVACEIVQALQTFVTRRIKTFDPVVLSVTRIQSGTTNNVIPEDAEITGTLRSLSERGRSYALEGLERIIMGIAATHEISAEVEIQRGYPVTVNDEDFAEFVREVSRDVLGENKWLDMPTPTMGAEDFSYVLQRTPGAMAFLGVRPEGEGRAAPCHSNRMLLNEEGMVAGIAMHAGLALRFLAAD